MQAAGRLIHLAVELAAGVQRGHDDLKRRLVRHFGVRVDRNAAAIVRHRKAAIGGKLHLDAAGMPRHRLVHGIVDHLGEQMVQGAFVRSTDIHAGAAAYRLQALKGPRWRTHHSHPR